MAWLRWISRFEITVLVVVQLSCGGDDGVTAPTTRILTTVQVTPSSATLAAIGDSRQFRAVARDAGGDSLPDVTFTWSSSDDPVATVDDRGLAVARGEGTVQVTATASGVSGSASLIVRQAVASVEVSPDAVVLPSMGATRQFEATARDANGHDVAGADFGWSSSDESVVTVDQNGLATAESFGTAWIVVALAGRSDSASVTVAIPGPISLLPEDWRLPIGEQVQFLAQVEGPGDETIAWTVNDMPGGNADVGTIDGGGLYTAPTSLPSGILVTVRAAVASDPTTFAESPVTITLDGEQARVLWHLSTPRVIANSSVDSARFEVSFSGYPRFELERPSGPTLTPVAIRSGVYGFSLSAAEVLTGYDEGDLHSFVGFLNCDVCAQVTRGNIFVNVSDATVPSVSVTSLRDDVQAGSHIVNIRYDDLFTAGSIPIDVLQTFYAYFPDDYDFVAVVEQVNSFNNRTYRGLRNDTDGLGLAMIDNGSGWGSPARLQGMIDYPTSVFFDQAEYGAIHEIGHRWMAFLDNTILATGVPHWPASSLARGLMGFSGVGGQGLHFPFEVRSVSGNTYELVCSDLADEFNDLELYLMGLLSPDSVEANVVFQDQNMSLSCGTRGVADPITIEDIVAVNGARNPDHEASQREFRLAAIVLSTGRLLSHEEMAFFNHMAERGEATTELHFTSGFWEGTTKPFYLATGRRATLTTRLLP